MKLLLAILLFAGIADAQAQNTVVHDSNGTAWVLQANQVQRYPKFTSGAYIMADTYYLFTAATGCDIGQGTLHFRPLAPEYKNEPFTMRQWSYNGDRFLDRLAIALCAEGLSK